MVEEGEYEGHRKWKEEETKSVEVNG